MAHFIVKRGAIFLLTCQFSDNENIVLPLDTATISAELRNSQGSLIATLTVQPVAEQTGTLTLTYGGETSSWPLGVLNCDIRVENQGITTYSQTFFIAVIERITQEGPANGV